MRIRILYILSIFSLTLLGCSERIPLEIPADEQISPSVYLEDTQKPPFATKALANSTTTHRLESNFLRLDETTSGAGIYEPWLKSYVLEGDIATAHTGTHNTRSVYLNPVQSYKYEGNSYYTTRMISWHPRTCTLHRNSQGIAAVTQFEYFSDQYKTGTDNPDSLWVVFDNLDGETDVMMSELQSATYADPFDSDKFFTYKHFLSAIKVYAYSENSAQSYHMWGQLRKVQVRNQPSSCRILLPTTDGVFPSEILFGDRISYFDIHKTPIYGYEDSSSENISAPESIDLSGTSSENPVYLGYALIAPGGDLYLDITTDAGAYSVVIPMKQTIEDDEVEVFQPGFIYEVKLNFKTDGTIASMLLKDGEDEYFDLTHGRADAGIFTHQTANCYIVDPLAHHQENGDYYDGYAFLANQIGNGDFGLLPGFPHTSTHIEPVRAGLIWESSKDLITQIEFMYEYVRFKLPVDTKGTPDKSDDTFTKGNAVIGVFDKSGNILWSWHIWITDTPKEQQFELTISGSEPQTQTITTLDRNLGALYGEIPDTPESALQSYGLYYQWGRKDPSMPPPTHNYRPLSTATSPYWDYFGDEFHSTSVINFGSPTIMDGVRHPMYIILPTEIAEFYQYDWLGEKNDVLWGDPSSLIIGKTIYDPCPFGYRVPQQELSSYLVSKEGNIYSHSYGITVPGANSETLFFPAAGYKGVDRGISSLTAAWKYVGEKGDYHSSHIHSNGHRLRTYISRVKSKWTETGADTDDDGIGDGSNTYNAQYITSDYANRRTAASVRCIKAELGNSLGQIFIKFSAPKWIYKGDKITLDYDAHSIHSNIASAVINIDRSDIDGGFQLLSNLEKNTPQQVKGQYQHTAEYAVDRVYQMVITNDHGIVERATQLVNVVNFTVSEIDDAEFNPETEYIVGQHKVKILVEGISAEESGYEILINGVHTTATTSDGKTYYTAENAHIAGQIHVAIEEGEAVVLSRDFEVKMGSASIGIELGEQVERAEELEHGKTYIIVASDGWSGEAQSLKGYYWKKEGNTLVLSNGELSEDNLFVWHTDHSVLNNINSWYNSKNSGAWMTTDFQLGLKNDFTFGATPDLMLIGSQYWSNTTKNMHIYERNGYQYLLYEPNGGNGYFSFSYGNSFNTHNWLIYEASVTTTP